jgi:hypothetical protein
MPYGLHAKTCKNGNEAIGKTVKSIEGSLIKGLIKVHTCFTKSICYVTCCIGPKIS